MGVVELQHEEHVDVVQVKRVDYDDFIDIVNQHVMHSVIEVDLLVEKD